MRLDGRLIEQHEPTGAFVATLLPGSRAAAPDTRPAGRDSAGCGARTRGAAAADQRAGQHAADTRPALADAGAARQPEDLDLEEVWIEPVQSADAELVEVVDADPAVDRSGRGATDRGRRRRARR